VRAVFTGLLKLAPLCLGCIAAWDVVARWGSPIEPTSDAYFALSALLVADLLTWAWIFINARSEYKPSFPDIALATLLGPAFVLGELPESVYKKRSRDRFVGAWTAIVVSLMLALMLTATSLKYLFLAAAVACDALIQANQRVGALGLLSKQRRIMTQYLHEGTRTDAY
jgi:hypothetical protein